jgi:5-formyltetrahydrofolate cyclo-ligase
VIASDEYLSSQSVLAYVAIRNEVSTADLLLHVLDSGRSLYLPRVVRGRRELEIVKVSDLTDDLSAGAFGIPEPVDALAAAGQSEIDEIGVAIIPGVAFDSMGYRLGYGAGYYDRFMSRLSAGCMSIGVCFEEQLVAELPRDPWDIPVKRVVAG